MNANEKGFNLYWENYNRAFEWQSYSKISHWKARARALEVENEILRGFIQRGLQPGPHQDDTSPLLRGYNNSGKFKEPIEKEADQMEENFDASNSDTEIDEDLLAFYEQTARHRIERKKQDLDRKRGSDDSQSENEKIYSMGPLSTVQNSTDMALLYGSDGPKILSMELSMQISFDMHRSKSNAQLWPNIPLRLS